MIRDTEWLERIGPVTRGPGFSRHQPGWIEPNRRIVDHELVLVRQGEMHFEVEDSDYIFTTDTFLIVPPNVFHASRHHGEGVLERGWVHFDWLWRGRPPATPIIVYGEEPIPESWVVERPDFIPSDFLYGEIREPNIVWDLFTRFSELYWKGTRRDQLRARSLMLDLLVLLFSESGGSPDAYTRSQRLANRTRQMLDGVAAKPQGAINSLAEVLEPLGCSYEHALRVFKQYYGTTPLEYINRMRLERAKYYLRETSLPLSRVAEEAGILNAAYFSRLFTERVGETPRDYRKRWE